MDRWNDAEYVDFEEIKVDKKSNPNDEVIEVEVEEIPSTQEFSVEVPFYFGNFEFGRGAFDFGNGAFDKRRRK